jgi:streptomycin 6-kinase
MDGTMSKPVDRFKNPRTRAGKYLLNNFIAWDQKWNVRFGGDPDETISSRLGKIKVKNGGKIPKHRVFSRILDHFLDTIDSGHSINAIEHDEGKDAILDRSGAV